MPKASATPNKHPSLKVQATLADFQEYVDVTNLYRGHNTDLLYCILLLSEEVGELAKAVRKSIGGRLDIAKSQAGIHADEEAADVLWVLLAICNGLGIDLEQAFRGKEEKNKKRTWK